MANYRYWWPLDSAGNPPGLNQVGDAEGGALLNIGVGDKVVFPDLAGSPSALPDAAGNCFLSADLMMVLRASAAAAEDLRAAFNLVSECDPKPRALNHSSSPPDWEDSFATRA